MSANKAIQNIAKILKEKIHVTIKYYREVCDIELDLIESKETRTQRFKIVEEEKKKACNKLNSLFEAYAQVAKLC